MKRRQIARLLTLVLVLELAILCCTCAHLHCHGGMREPGCALCRAAAALLRTSRLQVSLALMRVAAALFAMMCLPCPALPARTPVRRRVRLND